MDGYIPYHSLPSPLVRRLLVAQFVAIARVAGAAGVVDWVAVPGHFVFGQGAGEVAVGADLEAFEDGDGEGGGEVEVEEDENGGGERGEGWEAHFWFLSFFLRSFPFFDCFLLPSCDGRVVLSMLLFLIAQLPPWAFAMNFFGYLC